MSRRANALITEKSPYLLQHAHNPVDWRPWGPEAFATARAENKPLFLSIGYSTCHWCHVMERECFEDEDVAALLNSVAVPVKIDREERPDLDAVYMKACQMMTGAGGWPLSVFIDHQGRPFFAATFIPKASRFGRMGMMELLPALANVWNTRPEEVERAAGNVHQALLRLGEEKPEGAGALAEPDSALLDAAFDQLALRFDQKNGGFGDAPKFPSPHQLLFLLRRHARKEDRAALGMVLRTLTAMRLGGVFDQVGLGFHRYSTDAHWLLPHFEKMLYDQAMMLMACAEAFDASRDPLAERTAREVIRYVLRDMTSPEGAFYSAEDADSEGEEGKFYVWTVVEIRELLSPEDASLFIRLMNLRPEGNFADEASGELTGANIPHLREWPAPEDERRLEAIREVLFAQREKRVHPHKDDKVLTDWNGLMIAALAQAGRILSDPEPVEAASRAADFILARLRTPEGRLLHRYRDGDAAIAATLDDYAFLIWGLTELHQSTGDPVWLEASLELAGIMIRDFEDAENGGFYLTASDAEELLVRHKDFVDAALPSGNSAAMLVLLRLSRLCGRHELAEHAARTARAAGASLRTYASGYTMLLCGLDMALGRSADVVLSGPTPESLEPFRQALRASRLPDTLVLERPADGLGELAPYTAMMTPKDGKATAYVCVGGVCQPAVTDPEAMLRLLKS
ncbi:thioredoxin domain-containing protein [Fundidesulfovibrio soli]|uniref:thioredoxin domain-containing protein n=1 Tax=Fundidesulfovibrio soli TaxID=2922716 RepID=UPI001FAF4F0E|nr:thioredoxin domain-containing protein [Fundidesulfovibrio soli]